MANEYLVYAEDLTMIADAIREKRDTSEELSFPDGFISSIQSIDGINLNVVGGTTEPTNPTENMLWVNTDIEITEWCFSADEPGSPSNGMVWISTGTTSSAAFNILGENSAYIYPLYSRQYVDGVWVSKTTEIYQKSTWVDLATRLYYYGNEYYTFTGGFSQTWANNIGSKSFTKNSDNLYLASNGTETGGSNFTIAAANAIDLTRFSTLNARIKCTEMSDTDFRIAIHTSKGVATYEASRQSAISQNFDGVLSLDLSSVSGSYYILFGLSGSDNDNYGKCYVYEVFLL